MTAPSDATTVQFGSVGDGCAMPWAAGGPVLSHVAERVRVRLAAEAAAAGESFAAHPASISDAD
ncbi:hypothetical protein JQS43_20085 [Natronosporangium hydrolyticum]|uniref:Uncharacterized protein n=1 Tax=Natronosporangium hydrolyticum TaxID=2811111 RepID=A0A895YI67_9ACTN|nr:hypothetical protein [Natronosporangium hydrolyticum]QSB13830.1 hypothetical protein JQS43_20085 [Natronosporangium hydrolyticum]